MEKFIKINVGGSKFYVEKSSLLKYPATRLGDLDYGSQDFITDKGYLFFNRNPEVFQMILDFYRFDSIHIPGNICSEIVQRELTYWKIPFDRIAECCRYRILKSDNKLVTIKRINSAFGSNRLVCGKGVKPKIVCFQRLWLFLEEPLSSRAAKLYNACYLLIVLLSVIMAFLLTEPSIKVPQFDLEAYKNFTYQWEIDFDNPKAVAAVTRKLPKWWYTIDRIFLAFFTLEFFLRLLVSPCKRDFLSSALNIFDIILNISMWFRVVLEIDPKITMKYLPLGWILGITYSMISLRLFRILRINKQYNELRVLFLSLRASCKELLLLLVTFMILAALFANFIYYAEFNEPTTFPTAFSGMWWSVVTLTTVGYGDSVPISIGGKIVGGICATCGLIFLAMPIAIIASKFNEHYEAMKDFISFKKLLTKIDVTMTANHHSVGTGIEGKLI